MSAGPWTTRLRGVAPCRALRQFLEEREREGGWEARHTGGGHVQLRRADGTGPLVTMVGTPGDKRSLANARAQCRRVLRGQGLRV